MAGRVGGDLVGVHVSSDDGLTHGRRRTAVGPAATGGTARRSSARRRCARRPPKDWSSFAHAEKATQLVLGASRRSRWHELLHGSFAGRVMRAADDIDVHVIADQGPLRPTAPSGSAPRRRQPPSGARSPGVAADDCRAAAADRRHGAVSRFDRTDDGAVAVPRLWCWSSPPIGGRMVAAVAAVVASLLVNWFFVVPYHTLTIAEPEQHRQPRRVRRRGDHRRFARRHRRPTSAGSRSGPASRRQRWPDRRRHWQPTPRRCPG